jgi:hypothetical protein
MDNQNTKLWVLVIGVLLILGISSFIIVSSVRQSVLQAQNVMQPVNDLTSNVATQVARVLNPTPTVLPDPVSIIHRINALARLETIQYSVEKVITAESGQGPFGFLFGDRLLLVAHGEVIAGIDLSLLQPEDLEVRGGGLYVRLPEAQIFIATLDNAQTYVYDRQMGVLNRGDINLETTARQAAEDEILKTALEDGILDQATVNAEKALERLLEELGYDEVIFVPFGGE